MARPREFSGLFDDILEYLLPTEPSANGSCFATEVSAVRCQTTVLRLVSLPICRTETARRDQRFALVMFGGFLRSGVIKASVFPSNKIFGRYIPTKI